MCALSFTGRSHASLSIRKLSERRIEPAPGSSRGGLTVAAKKCKERRAGCHDKQSLQLNRGKITGALGESAGETLKPSSSRPIDIGPACAPSLAPLTDGTSRLPTQPAWLVRRRAEAFYQSRRNGPEARSTLSSNSSSLLPTCPLTLFPKSRSRTATPAI